SRALAIAIQLCVARRPGIGLHLHFRAIDDGEKIVIPQAVKMYAFAQTEGHSFPWPTAVELGNFTAPVPQEGLLQRLRYLVTRAAVDFPTKGVKSVQGLATLGRQDMDCP